MKALCGLVCSAFLFLLLGSLGLAVLAQEAAPAAQPPAAPNDATAAKVKELISKGGYAYHLRDYAGALRLADEALKLDPKNAAALELRQMAAEGLAERAGMDWNALKFEQQERLLDQVRRKMVEPINWDQLPQGIKKSHPDDMAATYGPARQVARDNAAIVGKLEKTIAVDFKDATLAQVAGFLSTSGGVNVIVDPKATVGDAKAADATVTFTARDIKLVNVLKWVCRATGLHYTVRDQVVFITTKEGLEPLKVTGIYDVADLLAPIIDYNSEFYCNPSLSAIGPREFFNWISKYPYWYYQDYRGGMGLLPFGGPFPAWSDTIERVRFTQPDLEEMINSLIENEEAK
jgi:tetratricopeptide (TPR) repeat protein